MRTSSVAQAWPIAVSFAVNGALYGGLLSRYAEIATNANTSAATFGVALTVGALGGLAGSILAPFLMRVTTERFAVLAAGLAYAILSVMPSLAPNPGVLGAVFFVTGIVDGGHDVSMNTLTVRAQQRLQVPLMGRMHALWSLALAGGAAIGAAAAALGVAPTVHLSVMAGLLGVAQFVTARASSVTTGGSNDSASGGNHGWSPGRAAVAPSSGASLRFGARGLFAAIVLAAIAASYIEGPGQEWSAILLADAFDADAGTSAAAPFAFSVGLLIARVLLDPLRRRFTAQRIARVAAVLVILGAVTGILVADVHGVPITALAALALIGFGTGPIYPMLFDTADHLGQRHSISPATTASVISACSRIGAISAPVVVGALAQAAGASIVLAVIAVAGTLVLVTLPRGLRP